MAQKVKVLLIDDLDGGEAAETVAFAIDGRTYEVDLTSDNAGKFRALLEPYMKKGRRARSRSGSPHGKGRNGSGSTGTGQESAEIRSWAKKNGYEVNERGRVPASVRQAYESAHDRATI